MKRRIITTAVIASFATAIGFAKAYEHGFLSSRARAEYEHGIRLPDSAQDIRCAGDAWHGFLDRVAEVQFTMQREDLPGFLHSFASRSGYAVLPTTRIVPMAWGTGIINITSSSPVGDFLVLQVYNISSNVVGVSLLTDWN